MRFADVKSDIAFKKIFGNENKKAILISFLNAVLGLEDDKQIYDLTILNPYQAPKLADLKETTLDIKAKSKDSGNLFLKKKVSKPSKKTLIRKLYSILFSFLTIV
ncbi:transposase [Candidatus Magnetoovum chiemensis]|nr:transposase [Candidatus Magnetoovum chiemensis]